MRTDERSALSFADDDLAEGPTGVIEIPLLLPAEEISALELAAHRHGLTAGEMVRRLLREFISATLIRSKPC